MKAAVLTQALEALRAVKDAPTSHISAPYWQQCMYACNALEAEMEAPTAEVAQAQAELVCACGLSKEACRATRCCDAAPEPREPATQPAEVAAGVMAPFELTDEQSDQLYRLHTGDGYKPFDRRGFARLVADYVSTHQPAPEQAEPSTQRELPGMWEQSDFEGGATDSIQPIDMVLYCPKCHTQHIDAPDADNEQTIQPAGVESWSNPPHRSHLCDRCKYVWRPADVPTNGVAAVKTLGKTDSPTRTDSGALNNPPTILDMERSTYEEQMAEPRDMQDHMGDPCPLCKGWRMTVGDYTCWGFCYGCYRSLENSGSHE